MVTSVIYLLLYSSLIAFIVYRTNSNGKYIRHFMSLFLKGLVLLSALFFFYFGMFYLTFLIVIVAFLIWLFRR